jgi:predicted dehydrogenase
LLTAYGPRFGGIWRTVKRLASGGALGRLRQISLAMQMYRRWKWDPQLTPPGHEATLRSLADGAGVPVSLFDEWGQAWRSETAGMGGGAFADVTVHWLDLALWLAGAPPVQVVAFGETAGMPVDCVVAAQARLANGVLLSVSSADAVPEGVLGGSRQIMIVGDDALIQQDRDGSLWLKRSVGSEKVEVDVAGSDPDADFVRVVLDGAENPAPPRECAWSVALVEAVYRSAQEGRIVQTAYPLAPADEPPRR